MFLVQNKFVIRYLNCNAIFSNRYDKHISQITETTDRVTMNIKERLEIQKTENMTIANMNNSNKTAKIHAYAFE